MKRSVTNVLCFLCLSFFIVACEKPADTTAVVVQVTDQADSDAVQTVRATEQKITFINNYYPMMAVKIYALDGNKEKIFPISMYSLAEFELLWSDRYELYTYQGYPVTTIDMNWGGKGSDFVFQKLRSQSDQYNYVNLLYRSYNDCIAPIMMNNNGQGFLQARLYETVDNVGPSKVSASIEPVKLNPLHLEILISEWANPKTYEFSTHKFNPNEVKQVVIRNNTKYPMKKKLSVLNAGDWSTTLYPGPDWPEDISKPSCFLTEGGFVLQQISFGKNHGCDCDNFNSQWSVYPGTLIYEPMKGMVTKLIDFKKGVCHSIVDPDGIKGGGGRPVYIEVVAPAAGNSIIYIDISELPAYY